MRHNLFVALVLSAAPWVHAAPTTFTVGEAVKTTSGIAKGHPHKNFPQISEYLGIRYGQPTSGNLRFAKPVRYASSETFMADKYGDDCPGVLSNPPPGIMADLAVLMQNGTKASEDCLTLNIFTKPQTGEKAKAVMLWIYGGGFALGDSTTPLYDGGLLADEQDVVIVTFNYRLHVFGFPGGPNGTDQNVGLLDQRLAAEWVRDNIAAFGGDPKRITLFGESAGAGSVDMYSYAWAEDPDPIANGFIPQSGSAGALTGPIQASGWYGVSKAVGCGGQEKGTETVACMRSKKWEDLIGNGRSSMFMPSPDGKVVFSDYGARQAAGKFIKKVSALGP
jgi:carboxylesterase type B